jgi:hypothetical protein
MRTRITIAALAALVMAAPAAAQSTASVAAAKFDTMQVDRARKLLARGERRWEAYDLKGARSAYAAATHIMLEQQVYAGPALLSLAYVNYAEGRVAEAGKVLVEASAEAARFGDVELQATSLYEASIAYAEAGDRKAARALRAEAQRLLGSSRMSVATREKLAVRMALGD